MHRKLVRAAAPACMSCRPGGRDLKALELIGDAGELVMYRTFAVCRQCRDWVEI